MFRAQSTEAGKTYRLAILALLLLSVVTLTVTIWIMFDFLREQETVGELIKQLPADARESAEALAGELRWQFRLTTLVVLNLVVTGFAVLLLWRAYRSSQESLRDIKALAGDILSSVDLAIVTTDQDGLVTSINRRGIELLRLTDEFVGRALNELSQQVPLDEFRSDAAATESGSLSRDFSTSAYDEKRGLRAFCQPLRDHENVIMGSVIQLRDVTERVLVDERMRRMERYMGLGSLAAGLHHEIKNPLAALSLHVQLLEEELDIQNPSDEVQRMLGVIRTEMTRVGAVLESFRDFASTGRLNLDDVDLSKLIDRQLTLIGPQAKIRGIEISVDVPSAIPVVNVDRVRIEQVLLNLLVNAMQAMSHGGKLTLKVIIDDSTEKQLRIEVADTGPGVPESIRDRIFDAYFTTKSEGTGMGLALSDKIMREHGGSLDFHSSSGGTVFELTVPTKQ